MGHKALNSLYSLSGNRAKRWLLPVWVFCAYVLVPTHNKIGFVPYGIGDNDSAVAYFIYWIINALNIIREAFASHYSFMNPYEKIDKSLPEILAGSKKYIRI